MAAHGRGDCRGLSRIAGAGAGCGAAVLSKGGRSIDAVEAAIKTMEDDPLFNAGRGAAFDSEGKNEMDAAIMDGATLEAGSVAGVSATKNPIVLARAVMEHSPYVMMVGPGADTFAISQHIQQMPPSYFFTEMRWQELLGVLRAQGKPLPSRPPGVRMRRHAMLFDGVKPFAHRFGTVGGCGARCAWRHQRGHFYRRDAGQDCRDVSAIRPSSAPVLMRRTIRARYPQPGWASISSGWMRQRRSARW